jgi:3-oxoacyl-[acyl-carrier protein] reductase
MTVPEVPATSRCLIDLSGLVAIVSGAAGGIGAAIAVELAGAGAAVAVLDLDEDRTDSIVTSIRRQGGRALGLGADVSDTPSVAVAVARTVEEFGELHIVVNNAGVTRDNLLEDLSDDDWDTVLRVNLRGVFVLTRAARPHLVKAGYGRVINLSSASVTGTRGQANYAAAKAGIIGFTKTVANELGPHGTTANAIAPGYIETAMTRAQAERAGIPLEEKLASIADRLPVRRTGQPEDIAAAAAFLASPRAGYITGQVLFVDGGWTL